MKMTSKKARRCVASEERFAGGSVMAIFNWWRELDGARHQATETVMFTQGGHVVSQPLPHLNLKPRFSIFDRQPASQVTPHGKELLIEHVIDAEHTAPGQVAGEVRIARVDLETWNITNLNFEGRRDPYSKRHFAQANTSRRVAIIEEWTEEGPSDVPRNMRAVHNDIWVHELDGSLRHLITFDGSITPLLHSGRSVQWSPDDRFLAVATHPINRLRYMLSVLHIVDVQTGSVIVQTKGLLHGSANWSPDGTKLLSGNRRYFDLTTGEYHLLPSIPEDFRHGGGRPLVMGFADDNHIVTYAERHRGEIASATFGTAPLDGTEITPQIRFTTSAFTYPGIVTPWPLPLN